MKKYRVAVLGLGMGGEWAKAAVELPTTELCMVYDPAFGKYSRIDTNYYLSRNIPVAKTEDEIYASDADIVVVGSPDQFHAGQSVRALMAGKHVACEKPLAPTVADCRKIIEAVKKSGKEFMTGQVCRYAPCFLVMKQIIDSGRIGEIVAVEGAYAHDYAFSDVKAVKGDIDSSGWEGWRKSKEVGRYGFIGGGCHALDLLRFLAGNPTEVTCYMNHKFLTDWAKPDTGVAIAKFPNDVIGRIFVSIGTKAPYTMQTIVYGTKGTLRYRDEAFVEIAEESIYTTSKEFKFTKIPSLGVAHHIKFELEAFVDHLANGTFFPSDVYEGTGTVAFAEAAIRSAETGLPQKVAADYLD